MSTTPSIEEFTSAQFKAMTIEDQARALLDPTLAECVRQRTELGIRKYGQRLDDNHQAERDRAIHLIQELLDAVQYGLWAGWRFVARDAAALADEVQTHYGFTAEEITAGGKQ